MTNPDTLAPSARMSDPDYPGAVWQLAADWRLAVSMDGRRYVLQSRADTPEGPRWVPAGGRCPSTPAKIVAKFGGVVPGLADAFAKLPADPAEAAPSFAASRAALLEAFRLTDVRLDGYGGDLAREGSLRVVVSPCGSRYHLQWQLKREIGTGADWRTVASGSALSDLWQYVCSDVFSPVGPGPANRLEGDELRPLWDAFVAGLPECPHKGLAPAVPQRPSSRRKP